MTSDDAMERIEGFHCVFFYAQAHIWNFAADAACGPRGEQGEKSVLPA